MREQFTNERGNAALYLVWLLSIIAIIFLIVINISNVFVTGAQSSNAAEQAAIAGTSVVVNETKEAIRQYDNDPLSITERLHHDMKTMTEVIEDKQHDYQADGDSADQAYIKALNQVLPGEIQAHPLLKSTIQDHFSSIGLTNKINAAARSIIEENHGNGADTIVSFSYDWQIEVKSTVDFNSISDNKYIPEFTEKIDGEGLGPALEYLSSVDY
ncbi:pilus assembly protein TadG-related protein [Gracilibacillus salinarum]|uniref:Pilus assembly protein TadG-related protein n=1 Tax=Gracilibacillus salinarum TaxID=2932255 RepID=A0ABY4GH91_9BACI|nr:pilus assembly protein TadG-related protein [Gracilibacillus salinarum]UOQ83622.1 pilus assembly protein TadG-related protein [Gracilibacillus salinarum]